MFRNLRLLATGLVLLTVVAGCNREDGILDPAEFPTDAEVFLDGFPQGVDFQAFGGSKLDALSTISSGAFTGAGAIQIDVPGPGDPSGGYAGGALVADIGRDLTGYDALTFWARASKDATLDVVGFGNDNSGTSMYTTEMNDVALSTNWTKFVVPIPRASALTAEAGLFYFAEGPEGDVGYQIFFDEIQFERLGTITRPRPVLGTQTVSGTVGATQQLPNPQVTFQVDGQDVTVTAAPAYFYFNSANEAVATVDDAGLVTIVGDGTTTIAATLGQTAAQGLVTVSAAELPSAPPTPIYDPANVISLFSDAYTDVAVDTWSAEWDAADVMDFDLEGNTTKMYTELVFAGIEFTSSPIDASAMTSFRMDVWTPDPTASPAVFKIKLVDFGADGAFAGGDDSEHELSFSASTSQIGRAHV